jgi:hypothetical protein
MQALAFQRQVTRAEAAALRLFGAAFFRTQPAPLLAVELLADPVRRGNNIALLVPESQPQKEGKHF